MTSFIFTRENKNCTISAIDLQNLKLVKKECEKEIDLKFHNLTFGSKPADFEIPIIDFKPKKSWPQLKGIHRQCRMLAVRLTESSGVPYDEDAAKLWVKTNFNYMRLATDEECVAEALNEKRRILTQGKKMGRQGFIDLVNTFKDTLLMPKSFKDAAMEELTDLIKKIEELGNKMDWPELKLTSEEERSLVEYYNK